MRFPLRHGAVCAGLGLAWLVACGGSSTPAVPPNADASLPADSGTGDTSPPPPPPPDATPDASLDASGPDAAVDAPAFPACASTPFPAPCEGDATTAPPAGTFGAPGPAPVTVDTLPNPRPGAPGVVSVYRPDGGTSTPVLFFSHAFNTQNVDRYDGLFRLLASHGVAVVFVPYDSVLGAAVRNKNEERYAQLWAGFVAATEAHASTFDLTRVGFVGHSFGGGATPELARKGFVEQGWGSAGRLMFVMAPWYSWGSAYETLPTDVRTVVQVYADDDTNDHQIAVSDIWNKLPAGLERRWLTVRSDACLCGLNAGHVVPMTSSNGKPENGSTSNGHDTWGVARRLHALTAYAFAGNAAAKGVAYGDDPSMGNWIGCGGRAVRPIESGTSPIPTACQPSQFPLAKRCANADPDYPCL